MLLTGDVPRADSQGQMLITGGGDGVVKLWQLGISLQRVVQVQQRATLESGDNSILSMALKDTLLYTGRLEGDVNVWDLDTRQLIQTIRTSKVDVLCLSVGYGYLFVGIANGRVKVSFYPSLYPD